MLKRSRIAILVVLLAVIVCGYTFQMMQYQIVDGDSYRETNSKSTVNTMEIIAPRGDILDRYGRVLATSTVGYAINIQKAYFPSDSEKQNTVLLSLKDILSESNEEWEDVLPISKTAPYTWDGSNSKKKALIKFVNEHKSKKESELSDDATVDEVMKKLTTYYDVESYNETQKRYLIGVRYTMVKNSFSTTKVYTFASNVGTDTITKIEERTASLSGAVISQVPVRSYPDGTVAPHIIGITGRISETELKENADKGYTTEDNYGKFGVEKTMESYLRGTNGVETVEQNSNGDVISTNITKDPQPGDNVILTLDKNLQLTLQDSLPKIIDSIKSEAVRNNTAGANARGAAAVVLNVKTGEVMAMATYPSFDLNNYYKNYSQLANDSLNPLFNRCIQGSYTPGSTFKPVVAVSGLVNGKITKDTYWNLSSQITIGSGSTAWTGHDDEGLARSNVNVTKAISVSSNIFFFQLGRMLGINKIGETAGAFGIGKKTGIELPNESAGSMSSVDLKKEKTGLAWYEADTAQASIGQFDTAITPLQLANYVSTMVKGGKEYQVHVVRQVNNYDNSKVIVDNTNPKVISDAKISANVINTVKEGMLSVTETGTASSVFSSFNMQVGGKTGTAQITKTAYNGVFICFAPFDDPEIAIATVVEYGHNGYQTAPAAKTAIAKYFGVDENTGAALSPSLQVDKIGSLIK